MEHFSQFLIIVVTLLGRMAGRRGIFWCESLSGWSFLFYHEMVHTYEILPVVRDFIPSPECDVWRWHHSKDDSYYMTLNFSGLISLDFPLYFQSTSVESVLPCIWSSWAPFKVIVLSCAFSAWLENPISHLSQ